MYLLVEQKQTLRILHCSFTGFFCLRKQKNKIETKIVSSFL